MAVPPGPVGVTAIKFGLDDKIRQGTLFATGTGALDGAFCSLAFAATHLLDILISGVDNANPILILAFQLFVVAAIIAFGALQLRKKSIPVKDEKTNKIIKRKESKIMHYLTHKGPFLLGVGIAITNIANPTFLPSLTILATYIHSLNIIERTPIANLGFAFGFGLGNFLWLYILVRLIAHYRNKMSDALLARIHKFAGITIIGLGAILGARVLILAKWSEIFRLLVVF